jgi:outer membrane protein
MPGFAGAAGSAVGVIDLARAVTSHPDYESNMAVFNSFETQQYARLDEYRDKESLSDADKAAVLEIRLDIEEQLANKLDELTAPLEQDVMDAVGQIGAESGIEVIVDAQVVLYGGLDLTPAVIAALGG